MTWKPEIDELRRRTELAKADGRARQGRPSARVRQAHGARARRAHRRPGSFDEIGTVAGVGHLRRRRASCSAFHAVELRVRRGRGRRPPGHRLGRRLHRARRLGRRVDRRQAQPRRGPRARAAAAAHPPGGRHGRRRFGEDDREMGRTLHLADAGLGDDPRAPRRSRRRCRSHSARSPASAPPAWRRATTR